MDDENTSAIGEPMSLKERRARQQNARRVFLDSSSPSFRSILRVVVITLLLLFVANRLETIITSLTYLFFLLILSIFFAYFLDPLVKLIRSPFKSRSIERFMPRSIAIVIAYAIVFTIAGLVVANIAPRVVEQGKEFGASLPTYASSIRGSFNDLNRRFDRLRIPEEVQTRINDQVSALGERITTSFGGFLIDLVSYLPWLIIIPILSFFFLKDVNLIRITILRMFPPGRLRSRAEAVLEDFNTTLAAYTRAQLISCLLIGTICTLGFYLIGLKYALLLGILAGIFEFVPLIGPLTIGIIAVATAAFGEEPTRAIYTAVFLIVLRITHDYVTYPRIVRGGIHLHPLLIILSVLAGEQVAGIPGVFLAIPIVALITVIYRHVLEHQGSRGLLASLTEEESADEAV